MGKRGGSANQGDGLPEGGEDPTATTDMETNSEIATGKLARNTRNGMRKPEARSAVTNGRDVLPGVDGRTLIARRYHDIMSAILIDQGGEDRCSESRKQLIRRFAAAALLAEQMEARLCTGQEVNIQDHAC